jgi:NAD(P)-dependent dehydrogenase (short-subunit alcohol dehydrogenase family)
MDMTFESKVVFVTGAGRGIGRGIARHLLNLGASVLIAEYDQAAGSAAVRELASLGPVEFVATDVGDEASVVSAVGRCLERFGHIDALVNNAGIADPHSGPLEALSFERWERVIRTNLGGVMLCAKHCVPELRERSGAIVNIASTRALQSEPNTEAYAAAKGGVVALTHALAISLGPAVRVNCISPGWIDTRDSQLSQRDRAQHPVGRVGVPDDVARLTEFLLGEGAGFITGQNFVVDGGMTRKMIYEA